MISAIIVAGGSGKRMGGLLPKQFLRLGSTTILEHTLRVFCSCRQIGEVILVVSPERVAALGKQLMGKPAYKKLAVVVGGGAERYFSVRNGLLALHRKSSLVLIHDAVRPFCTHRMIRECAAAADKTGAAAVGIIPRDTIKRIKGTVIAGTLDRNQLLQIQTPQAFRTDLIKKLYQKGKNLGTDECYAVEKAGHKVTWIAGNAANFKITTPEDLEMARLWIKKFKA
jgi:2-C-methyl-D-erythritol 4-phosphate cytidylyltransferase